jgi:hypothetical protein
MTTRFVDLERRQLFEQFWSQPVVQLAKAYGVRPADIKCAALALALPTPPSGHWTRVAFGKGMAIPSLPEFVGATIYRVILRVDSDDAEVERRFRSEQARVIAPQTMLPDLRTNVADCGPLIRRMHARLRERIIDKRGWPMVPAAYGLFALNVSPGHQVRALLAFDRVLRHCEAAGFSVDADETSVAPAVLTVSGLAFTLRIYDTSRASARSWHSPSSNAQGPR